MRTFLAWPRRSMSEACKAREPPKSNKNGRLLCESATSMVRPGEMGSSPLSPEKNQLTSRRIARSVDLEKGVSYASAGNGELQ